MERSVWWAFHCWSAVFETIPVCPQPKPPADKYRRVISEGHANLQPLCTLILQRPYFSWTASVYHISNDTVSGLLKMPAVNGGYSGAVPQAAQLPLRVPVLSLTSGVLIWSWPSAHSSCCHFNLSEHSAQPPLGWNWKETHASERQLTLWRSWQVFVVGGTAGLLSMSTPKACGVCVQSLLLAPLGTLEFQLFLKWKQMWESPTLSFCIIISCQWQVIVWWQRTRGQKID